MLKEKRLGDILGNDIIFGQIDECKERYNLAISNGDIVSAKWHYEQLQGHYKDLGLIITNALKKDYITEILSLED